MPQAQSRIFMTEFRIPCENQSRHRLNHPNQRRSPGGTATLLVIVGATGTINDFPPQIISLASQYKMSSIQVWPLSLQWGNTLNVLDSHLSVEYTHCWLTNWLDNSSFLMGHPISAEKVLEPLLIGWLSAIVDYSQLAGQELCLLHIDRLAEGCGFLYSTGWPRTILTPCW